jgi:hypothetical protein
MSKQFPFMVGEPYKMTILEQVMCMVWLATNKTLKELRVCQCLVEEQQKRARVNNCPEKTFANLAAMMDNYCAAVAYKEFPCHDTWMAFVNTPQI